jgi:hypothetical protein
VKSLARATCGEFWRCVFLGNLTAHKAVAVAVCDLGLVLGAISLYFTHQYVPLEHLVKGREGPDKSKLTRIWLFVIAITLHNFPEVWQSEWDSPARSAIQPYSKRSVSVYKNIPEIPQ